LVQRELDRLPNPAVKLEELLAHLREQLREDARRGVEAIARRYVESSGRTVVEEVIRQYAGSQGVEVAEELIRAATREIVPTIAERLVQRELERLPGPAAKVEEVLAQLREQLREDARRAIETIAPFKNAGVGENHNIYDIIPDSKNNVYFTDIAADYIGRVDSKTSEVKLYPMPTSPGLSNNFAYTNLRTQDNDATDVRVDHRFQRSEHRVHALFVQQDRHRHAEPLPAFNQLAKTRDAVEVGLAHRAEHPRPNLVRLERDDQKQSAYPRILLV